MAIIFPTTGLDNFTNPTAGDYLGDAPVLHSTQHANLNDATEAIEAKIGIDYSNINNSLDYISKLLLMTNLQHQDGAFREYSYVGGNPPIISSIIWYTNSGKTIKLIEKDYTYGSSIRVLPTTCTLKLYDGTISNVLKRTITDTIVYDRVFEISRTRIVVWLIYL